MRRALSTAAVIMIAAHPVAAEKTKAEIIQEVDTTALLYTAFLFDCERVMTPSLRQSWQLHRQFIISSLSEIYPTRDRALVRFDELTTFANSRIDPMESEDSCLAVLDKLRHDLDVSVAHLREGKG